MYVRVCGAREQEQTPGNLARWPMGLVTYFEAMDFPGLARDAVAAAFDAAAGQWTAVAGIVLRRVLDAGQANIVATTGTMDGPYGVLAQSDLPFGVGPTSVLHQLFDDAEPWASEVPGMLVACITHELGHALGLGHLPGTGALMEPIIIPGQVAPQPPDLVEIQGAVRAAGDGRALRGGFRIARPELRPLRAGALLRRPGRRGEGA